MKKLLFLLCVLVVPMVGKSQKTLKEWSELDEKKWAKQLTFNSYLGNLKRYVKTEEQKPKVDRVGLLTFYMFTPNPDLKNVYVLRPQQMKDGTSSYFAQELFTQAYPGLVRGFKEKGITLLELNEYLDTDEKKSLYTTTEFEASSLASMTAKWAAKLSARDARGDAKATPEGYKLITETNWDIKLMRTIGDFSKKVGIDAVICVQHQISWNGEVLYFGPLTMSLIGPNPIPENEDDWYAPMGPLKGYLEGFIYGAVIVKPKEGYFLGFANNKKGFEHNFWELNLIYDRAAQSLVDYVNEEIDKLVK